MPAHPEQRRLFWALGWYLYSLIPATFMCRRQQTVLLRAESMMLMMQTQTLARTTSGRKLLPSLQVPGPSSCSYIALFWPSCLHDMHLCSLSCGFLQILKRSGLSDPAHSVSLLDCQR